jgi:hypothetical protein
MFYHGHFTHPDLWLMWYAILLSTINFIAVAVHVATKLLRRILWKRSVVRFL